MSDDCCKGKIKLVGLVVEPGSVKLRGPISAGIMNQNTKRAMEIIRKISGKLHIDEVDGIGHIHGILSEQEKRELLEMRSELIKLLPNVPERDLSEHINTLLGAACGSVSAFIANGEIEEHEFDRFYSLLSHIDLHFKAGTSQEEQEHLGKLRDQILESLKRLPETDRDKVQVALSNSKDETVNFVLGEE